MSDLDTIRERHADCKDRKCLYYGGFRPCDTRVVLDALDKEHERHVRWGTAYEEARADADRLAEALRDCSDDTDDARGALRQHEEER